METWKPGKRFPRFQVSRVPGFLGFQISRFPRFPGFLVQLRSSDLRLRICGSEVDPQESANKHAHSEDPQILGLRSSDLRLRICGSEVDPQESANKHAHSEGLRL